ncbi:UxaA family hydrolase [Natroniella sulfidigena]|uniref:UxaA family hydrolase n=1 Tax=Natroniella sulfidigena TaxID=723921 RepID=UPI00200A6A9C|nr:UxaA family hydrolase [Natroniella sulfidigena]MCK8818040.1 UxaA family hydrolase [Natroniella sulfidigena]
MKIKAYRRENGEVGIRKHLVILPTSVCASETAVRIAEHITEAIPLPHQHGCCQVGADADQTVDTLVGLGKNPNVAAVLVVGLGCEGAEPAEVADRIAQTGKAVEKITIQDCGGTLKAIEEGTRIARDLANDVVLMEKEEVDISEITLAIECGGTDATSGIAANPAVGGASDKLIELGGTSMLSETTELIGAEHVLAKRAASEEVADQLLKTVKHIEDKAMRLGVDIRGGQPTPGNIEGGVTTIEEKSLGCMYKAGTATIEGVLEYAEAPTKKGFHIMDTPGQDIESITGMLAGGAQVVIFTTGRGTPTGAPLAPVIKVTGNSETYQNMIDNIDINAGKIIDQGLTLEDLSEEIFATMVDVCNGKKTKAELLEHHEFGIHKLTSTF